MRLRAAQQRVPSGGLLFVYDVAATGLRIVLSLMLRFETLDWSTAVAPYLPGALLPLLVRPPVSAATVLAAVAGRMKTTRPTLHRELA